LRFGQPINGRDQLRKNAELQMASVLQWIGLAFNIGV
jgi:hypothetical protein